MPIPSNIQAACVIGLTLAFGVIGDDTFALAPERAFHHYVKDVWSIEEGLPQITVNDIVQGPEGYIWAATQSGLARFDGVRFRTFDPPNTPEMPGLFVQALHVDGAGRLWVGTYRGVMVFEDGEFAAIDVALDRNVEVHGFAETDYARILVASGDGLMEVRDDTLVPIAQAPDVPLWSIIHHDGQTVAGGRGKVLHSRGDSWERHSLGEEMGNARVVAFARHDGLLWAGTSRGLFFFDEDRWQAFEADGLPDDLVVEALHSDRDGNFWIGADDELVRVRGREVVEVIDNEHPMRTRACCR